ncbi:hypothetical protein ACFE04_000069 [Oxalis oulophora]
MKKSEVNEIKQRNSPLQRKIHNVIQKSRKNTTLKPVTGLTCDAARNELNNGGCACWWCALAGEKKDEFAKEKERETEKKRRQLLRWVKVIASCACERGS